MSAKFRAPHGLQVPSWYHGAMNLGWARLAALAVLCAVGCETQPASQITVVVRTDLAIGEDITHLRLQTLRATGLASGDDRILELAPAASGGHFAVPLSFGVVPASHRIDDRVRVVVTGLRAQDAEGTELRPVVRAQAVTAFRRHYNGLLNMFLGRNCLDLLCLPDGSDSEQIADQVCDPNTRLCGAIPVFDDLDSFHEGEELDPPFDVPADAGGDSAVPDAQVGPDAALDWVRLEGGSFQMGSTDFPDSQPVHEVTVPAFRMARTEVTVAQYRACLLAGACAEPSSFSANCFWNRPDRDDYPVSCLGRTMARAFCAWAGGRLPSEAEWEYAARSLGKNYRFPWGDEPPTCDYAVIANSDGWGCGRGSPWPVCSRALGHTEQGLCDMAGNVLEWIEDDRHDDYVGAPTDGTAWDPGGKIGITRGSFFTSNDSQILNTDRGPYFDNTYVNDFLGVRCASDIP